MITHDATMSVNLSIGTQNIFLCTNVAAFNRVNTVILRQYHDQFLVSQFLIGGGGGENVRIIILLM